MCVWYSLIPEPDYSIVREPVEGAVPEFLVFEAKLLKVASSNTIYIIMEMIRDLSLLNGSYRSVNINSIILSYCNCSLFITPA